MNAENFEVTVIESETVNDDFTITLLETLKKKYASVIIIYVIFDNARFLYSKNVMAYLEKSRIRLVFLPKSTFKLKGCGIFLINEFFTLNIMKN